MLKEHSGFNPFMQNVNTARFLKWLTIIQQYAWKS